MLNPAHYRMRRRVTTILQRAASGQSPFRSVSIDTSNLVQRNPNTIAGNPFNNLSSSSMERELIKLIGLRGPLSIAEYMRQVLVHPLYGYYTEKEQVDSNRKEINSISKIFGPRGDFTTSPEISQLFGEMIAINITSQWVEMGEPENCCVVELGPGRGTLMKDMMNVWKSSESGVFKRFYKSVKEIKFVERSRTLREVQCATIGGGEMKLVTSRKSEEEEGDEDEEEDEDEEKKIIKQEIEDAKLMLAAKMDAMGFGINNRGKKTKQQPAQKQQHQQLQFPQKDRLASAKIDGKTLSWHDSFGDTAPESSHESPTHFIVAQELLDALPVYSFEYTPGGWRERLVDVDISGEQLCLVKSKGATVAVKGLLGEWENSHNEAEKQKKHKFSYGQIVEVCPEAITLSLDIAQRISETGGSALFFDYGSENYKGGHTLRGYHKHTEVGILEKPIGEVDITGDVDFNRIKQSVERSCWGETVRVNLETQGNWLVGGGICERLKMLIENENVTEDEANLLYCGFERIAGEAEGQMGKVYKCMELKAAH